MDRLLAVAVLTALIHLINTLIYSVRVSGVRTGRLATAISLFNVVFLIASTANMIQGPLLATIVEGAIHRGGLGVLTPAMEREMNFPPQYLDQMNNLAGEIRLVILAATLGTVLGALLIPASAEVFARAISVFDRVGSVPGMILMAVFSPRRVIRLAGRDRADPPPGRSPDGHAKGPGIPRLFLAANVLVTGIFTTGVLSALYAGALYPGYRASATMLASIVNGIAQVLFATVVDPAAARITDQALQGRRPESDVRRMAIYLAVTRLAGTLLAQAVFLPAARLIRWVAVHIT
ncbi:MAG: lipid II flippase Amj family protein [Peptococcaceae bacterium]|nr:lipid II flippase Amj family protein [Peptococcaceae bacterium]